MELYGPSKCTKEAVWTASHSLQLFHCLAKTRNLERANTFGNNKLVKKLATIIIGLAKTSITCCTVAEKTSITSSKTSITTLLEKSCFKNRRSRADAERSHWHFHISWWDGFKYCNNSNNWWNYNSLEHWKTEVCFFAESWLSVILVLVLWTH